ncbi:Diphthine methyl ester synthase [Porphyridium purpureum]|uniref:diphthine methyl ester synthase n=1 Tax=Porphyridium purpureum TaxID=35688 RepID=A0A5J4Z1C9_PORPP|nr:Diphthine methyl ester synthase [Porphyridium purpureum]|eukprot:POR7775..scf295_1
MLYVVGLGLGNEKDVSVRGLEAIRRCAHVYLEHYTSVLGVDCEALEAFYGCRVTLADREFVEERVDGMLHQAREADVAFLVVGDPFGATTHTDLLLRAREEQVDYEIVHNASIINAVGCCGLQLYNFGMCVSMVFFTDTWKPDSFYDKLAVNRRNGMHTLVLLDIKVKEPNMEQLARGRKVYEPARFMTVNVALEQMMEVERTRGEALYGTDTFVVGLARVGQPSQMIKYGPISELARHEFGAPLHSLIIPAPDHTLHESERDMLRSFR